MNHLEAYQERKAKRAAISKKARREAKRGGQNKRAEVVRYENGRIRFFPVWQTGPFRFEVPGAFRIGGVDVSLPGAMRYADGL